MERLKNGELHISVRNLVEIMLRSGDIDNRIGSGVDADSMLEGSRIHRMIQKQMGVEYRAEVAMSYRKEYENYDIVVEGRADGIFVTEEGLPAIDEIKTMKRDVRQLTEPIMVHEAQAKCYGYFFLDKLRQNGEANLPETNIVIQMTYCTQETEELKQFRHTYTGLELETWFSELIDGYRTWVDFLYQHAKKRTETVKPLLFPFDYRKGQRDMVVSVYRSLQRKKHLFVQAPTGIGKTMSALFPAVKSMGEGITEKVFYLTAKTITRTVAEESFRILADKGAAISFVTLTAKEKMCVAEEMDCNPYACERARGHFDRINEAVYDIITHESQITRELILEYSKKHMVCPFEFALDISYWVDGIVCDYNYVFDPRARLKRFFGEGMSGEYAFLIDEAHNMIDRAREMYSAKIYKEQFLQAKKWMGTRDKRITKLMEQCNKLMLSYKRECEDYMLLPDVHGLALQMTKLVEKLGGYLEEHKEFPERKDLLNFYFELSAFVNTHDYLDEGYQVYAEHDEDGFYIKLFCIDPAGRMKECLERGNSAVFFSATLLPVNYYKKLLTGNEEEYAIYVPSPFDREKRAVCIATDVTAKYTARGTAMYERFASYILEASSQKKGNYMVFCPSYKMMRDIYHATEAMITESMNTTLSNVKLSMQEANMSESAKEAFLLQFSEEREERLLAFCVLGGIFSEGIDLVGDKLIGSFVIGTGLPQVCNEREIIKRFFDQKDENGFDYAYRYPGMNKVLQAAGRVIRTKDDYGIMLLLDERFMQEANRALFPMEWEDAVYGGKENVLRRIREFW